MKPYTTSDRLKQIMEARHLKQVDIVNLAQPYCKKYDVHLGKSTISQYVSGKTEPSQWKLTVLGLALNVSEAWLMGYDVPQERLSDTDKKLLAQIGEELLDAELIRRLCNLTPGELEKVDAFVQGLLAAR